MSSGLAHIASDEISVLRDVQMAQEIRSLAALGIFPKGILVYGLVYYKHSRRHYMISTDPAKLIAFLNNVENRKFFPTPMESYTESLIIPEGEEEDIINRVKLKLVRMLQKKYPPEVFAVLERLNQRENNDVMDQSLLTYRADLESVFDIDKIRAFRDLCIRAYLRKNVSDLTYHQLIDWCEFRLAQLADYLPPMGRTEKIFYGMAVLEENHIKRTIINANLSCIYQEKCKLEQQGQYITSWHERIFTMERQESLRAVNQQMDMFLADIYDDQMIALIDGLEHAPVTINNEVLQQVLTDMNVHGEDVLGLIRYYGQMWGAIPTRIKEGGHAVSK